MTTESQAPDDVIDTEHNKGWVFSLLDGIGLLLLVFFLFITAYVSVHLLQYVTFLSYIK